MAEKAHVHCVIIGFSAAPSDAPRRIYIGKDEFIEVKHINTYLMDAEDVFVESRTNALYDVPPMVYGNKPTDGGYLILSPEERDQALRSEPQLAEWIRPYWGAQEFLNNKPSKDLRRFCLWLTKASPATIRESKFIFQRVSAVKEFRLKSKAAATREFANIPHLFVQRTQPEKQPFLLIPRVSSERRQYVPIGFMSLDDITSDSVQLIPSAGLYHFGILTSSVHNAWMRAVCGRLKSDYRYSKDIVYNNFPWPTATEADRAKIEATAKAILDAREAYPDSSLADLYDATAMPPDLRRAHSRNDAAVLRLYGLPADAPEPTIVAHLMNLYKELTAKNEK